MKKPKPQGCEGCPLHSAPGPIPAQGSYEDAKIIYITGQPSPQDMAANRPLSDSAGAVLNRQLYEAGVSRSDLFVVNLVRCSTPQNRPPTPAEIQHCKHFLDRDLERCKADTVVLAGQQVFDTQIGSYSSLLPSYRPTSNIHMRMGCVEHRHGRKWIGTIHPTDYMRMVMIRDEAVDHLRKASLISGQTINLPTIHTRVSDNDVADIVQIIKRDVGAFADDVETHQSQNVEDEEDYVGGDYEMDMAGISVGSNQAIVVNTGQVHLLTPLFNDPAIWCYEHNGMYDQYHIAKVIGHHEMYSAPGVRHNPWMDGMLAAHYHKSFKRKALKPYCLSRYTTLPYYDRKLELIDRRYYNGMDNIATHQECVKLTHLLKDQGSWKAFMNIGMAILPLLEEQRALGVRCDLRKAYVFREVISAKVNKSLELLNQLGAGLNPTNPHHLKDLLYKVWKLPAQYAKDPKTRKEKLSTDYEARKRLLAFVDDPAHPERAAAYEIPKLIITLVDYYAGEKKKLEYLDRISGDGRIHAYYKAHGERPFRLSSSPNLQNFPVYDISDWGGARKATKGAPDPLGFKKPEQSLGSLRSLVIPDHDEDLILTCDFNQIQIWIYAVISGSRWLYDVFESRDYIYGIVYEKLYKEPFFKEGPGRGKDDKRKDIPEQRMRRAKAVPLGFLFGRTAEAVSKEYGWGLEEGYQLRKWWFDNNPELLRSYADTEFQLKQKGYVDQPYGVRMWYPEGKATEAINGRAQCPEAFIMMETMILIDKEFKRRGWKNTRVMLSVHDALSFNIGGARVNPQRMIEAYEEVVAPIMDRPIPELKNFCFRHEAVVSSEWDWNTIKYPKWKAQVLDARTRAANPDGDKAA